MKRRALLKVGATLAVGPVLLSAQEHGGANPTGKQATPDWKPSVLTPAQNATVIVLTELIIPATDTPGAREARVNQYIDLFLHDGPPVERERFLSGLNWLDDYARRKNAGAFDKLTAEQQIAILTDLSSSSPADQQPGRQFFGMIKSMTVAFYYSTATGYLELNKGGRVPGTFGCEHSAADKPSA